MYTPFIHRIRSLTFPERLILGLWCLFSVWLALSAGGIFSTFPIILSALVFSTPLLFFRNQKHLNPSRHERILTFLICIGTPIMLIGWMLLRGFYTGDATGYWLPWARELALSHHMPEWISQLHMPHASAGPIFPLMLGALFAFLPIHELTSTAVPIIFFTSGLLVLIYWAREKNIPLQYQILTLLLVLFNSQTAFWSWNLLTESMLFLGITLFFYFFEKIWNSNDNLLVNSLESRNNKYGVADLGDPHVARNPDVCRDEHLVGVKSDRTPSLNYFGVQSNYYFLLMSFVFCILVKFSSIILIVPIAILVFKKYRLITNYQLLITNFGISFFIATPLLFWLIRNFLVYGDPLFPLLTSIIPGPFSHLALITDPFYYWQEQFPTTTSRVWFILKNTALTYPFIFLSLVGFWKSRFRSVYPTLTVSIILAGIFLIFSASSGMRYLWPYIGLFALYAAESVRTLSSRFLKTIFLLLAFLSPLMIEPIFSSSTFIHRIEMLVPFIGSAAQHIHTFWWLALLILIPISIRLTERQWIWKWSMAFLLPLTLLQTRWIANKSFLNTWTFLCTALGILVCVALTPTFFEKKKRIVLAGSAAFVALVFCTNSYAQAGMYYLNNGGITWPHPHIHEHARAVLPLINQHAPQKTDCLLTLGPAEYYVWYENRIALTLNSFGFAQRTTEQLYTPDMSAQETAALLHKGNIALVVGNLTEPDRPEKKILIETLHTHPEFFQEYCVGNTKLCVWEIPKNF